MADTNQNERATFQPQPEPNWEAVRKEEAHKSWLQDRPTIVAIRTSDEARKAAWAEASSSPTQENRTAEQSAAQLRMGV